LNPAAAPEPILQSRAARVTLVMSCLFCAYGMTLAFLPRWLEVERNLDGAAIGAVLALAQFTRILTGPAAAFWADGAADRRTPIRLVLLAAIVAYAAFFFLAHDFWSLLLIGFVALSLTQVATPLVEAATLRATAEGKITYGIARGIGSITFIIANVAGGVLIARFGLIAVVVWTLTWISLAALSATATLKPDRPSQPVAGPARLDALRALLRSRRFLVIVFACGLIQSGHAFYYSFSVLVWRAQDIPAEIVGVLWAFGVAVEVALLWSLASIERRISPEALILLGAGGGFLRWLAMGFAPTGLVLWPLQALHALSFAAAHVGAMRLLYREAPESGAAMAQNIYAAVSSGLLMGAATLLSGVLYDEIGAGGYWAMAGLALAGGALALLLVPTPPRAPAATSH
jgi:MFS transporter, PPP family, 3-phenylpropionic acid transporter